MRFAFWASAGSAALSPLGTAIRVGVLRAPCKQPLRHWAPVFVEVFACGEVVCSATLSENLRAIDRRGPERPVQQQSAFFGIPRGFPLPVLSGAYICTQAYSAVAPMKVIRDLGNWERTGLCRLEICDRDRRHPVWTQAGSDAQRPGSAGPPPLAASTGEKKKPPPDCATFSISGWCFADWFVGSCFSVAERSGLMFGAIQYR